MATRLDIKHYLDRKYLELAEKVDMLEEKPKLATILVGDRADSAIYVNNKEKALKRAHMTSETFTITDGVPVDAIATLIMELNKNKEINGILLQLPLNREFYSKEDEDFLINLIDPLKDVDGLTLMNQGKLFNSHNPNTYLQPCTPTGIVEYLDFIESTDYLFLLNKARALVFGRSNLLGKPLAQMLMERGMTVTTIHSKSGFTAAEAIEHFKPHYIFLCTGQKNIMSAMDLMKHNYKSDTRGECTLVQGLIDAGISRDEKGIRGDFRKEDYSLLDERKEFAFVKYTTVPGGVGPLTTYSLAANTYKAYLLQKEV